MAKFLFSSSFVWFFGFFFKQTNTKQKKNKLSPNFYGGDPIFYRAVFPPTDEEASSVVANSSLHLVALTGSPPLPPPPAHLPSGPGTDKPVLPMTDPDFCGRAVTTDLISALRLVDTRITLSTSTTMWNLLQTSFTLPIPLKRRKTKKSLGATNGVSVTRPATKFTVEWETWYVCVCVCEDVGSAHVDRESRTGMR